MSNKFTDLKGSTSEYKAKLWLKKMYPTNDVAETNHFSELDRKGYDLIVHNNGNVRLVAQVKSSVDGAVAYMQHDLFDARVSIIVVQDGQSPYFYHKGKVL